jgi:beta-1,4-mannosyltransferase
VPDVRPLFRRSATASQARRVLSALQAAEDASGLDPVLLPFTPVARMNPYQSLLYRAAWEQGVAPVPVFDLHDAWHVVDLAGASPYPPLLHLHWTSGVLRDATDEADADARVERFLTDLAGYREQGGRVAWTVHNTLPHEARFHAAEVRLQQGLADACDLTHVMSPGAVDVVRETTRLREDTVLVVEHPHYVGCYPEHLSRDEARWSLGIEPVETVHALVGSLRANKGLGVLHDAFGRLRAEHPGRRRLLVAGGPDGSTEVDALVGSLRGDLDVLVDARKVPTDDVQLYLRAADVVVLPYLEYLNSGAALLALSFGVPVVGSRQGALAELLTPDTGVLFESTEPAAVAAAMREAELRFGRGGTAAARELALGHDPDRLSRRFCEGVRRAVGAPARGGA